MHRNVALDAFPGSARIVCVLDCWCNEWKERQPDTSIVNRGFRMW